MPRALLAIVLLALVLPGPGPVGAQTVDPAALALARADLPDGLQPNPTLSGPNSSAGFPSYQATYEGDPLRVAPGSGGVISVRSVVALPPDPIGGLAEHLQSVRQDLPGPLAELPPPPLGDESQAFTATASLGPFNLSAAAIAFRRNRAVASVMVLSAGGSPPVDLALRLAQVVDQRAVAAGGAPPPPPPAPAAPAVPPPPAAAPGGAPPAGTASSPPGPVAGLVGQTTTGCRAGAPFDAQVIEASQAPARDGALQIVLVVRVTNGGTQTTRSYLATQLVDERGRRFDQAVGGAGGGVDLVGLAAQHDAQHPSGEVRPGSTVRHVWGFLVPPDVQALTVVPDPLARC